MIDLLVELRSGFAGNLSLVAPLSEMKVNGRWPFIASGLPTTQASATSGCERIACRESISSHIDDIVTRAHEVHIIILSDHASITSIEPLALKTLWVAFVESVVIFEQRAKLRRREPLGIHDQ